ncbi:hypothetical protein LXL04_033593 [Taraxacum kok-saghyz]
MMVVVDRCKNLRERLTRIRMMHGGGYVVMNVRVHLHPRNRTSSDNSSYRNPSHTFSSCRIYFSLFNDFISLSRNISHNPDGGDELQVPFLGFDVEKMISTTPPLIVIVDIIQSTTFFWLKYRSSMRFLFRISKTIMIIFQIVSATTHDLNDFSTTANPNNNIKHESEIVSFDFPYPPSYPEGGDFGKGVINLGGLEVYKAVYFKKIWSTNTGGPNNQGASFYEPTFLPYGFNLLGHYCKPNSRDFFAAVLTVKDATHDPYIGSLTPPLDYTLIWTSKGANITKSEDGYIWLPIPPYGYKAIGHIVTTSPEKPSLDMVRCVRRDFTDLTTVDQWIWGLKTWKSPASINIYTTKPIDKELSVHAGTFLARAAGDNHELACLKMIRSDPYSSMPNSLQINAMIHAYAPMVYFHPDEEYLPSSVLWFFQNGAELHQTGRVWSNVVNDGENLPNNGSEDDSFLDLPQGDKDRVKRGFLPNATAYVHVKPENGGTFTDLVVWLYYPFNGGGKFQLGPFTINLGKIGEHVSDWEHMTLRVDNFYGHLKAIYLSRHSKGKWVMTQEFEFLNGSRPIVYASLHGHSHYTTPSYHLHETVEIDSDDMKVVYEVMRMNSSKLPIVKGEKFLGFGVRDDTAKGKNVMDIASSYQVVCVDYNTSYMEPWLNYTGRWGPKFTYKFTNEVIKITNHFPERFKALVIRILHKLPPELLGEEGPEGPKMRESWTGDERT